MHSQHIWRGPEVNVAAGETLVSLTLASARRAPDQLALVDALTGRSVGYGQLADRLLRVASSLSAAGLGKGDVVATLSPNSSAWLILTLGVMANDSVVTGMNPLLKPDEIRRQITMSGAKLLAVAPELVPMVESAGIDKIVAGLIVLGENGVGKHRSLADLLREGKPEPRRPSPDSLALLPFSSGTSGLPKGVEVLAGSLARTAVSARAALAVTERDVMLAVSPLFHIAAVTGIVAPALACARPIVMVPAPKVEIVLAAIERYRVSYTIVSPPFLRALLEHPAVEQHDLSSLRFIVSTAAPLSAELQTAVARRLGVPVRQGYGMTESTSAITLDPLDAPRPGGCGKVAPNFEIRIVDPETGEDMPADARGEIWFRSPMMMRAYHNDPGATVETVTPDGWLRTGDVGRFDADGYLFIVDRLKELIKVGGAQVAPSELEAVIAAYPGVADVAVVGQPSAAAGERPVAYVVACKPIGADALMGWVAERVAPFKQLHAVEIIDSIPRQPNGKVMRRLLKERQRAVA
jgi:acyl-CoA synthetase (AMP-forming)/AMP-acid ligase II